MTALATPVPTTAAVPPVLTLGVRAPVATLTVLRPNWLKDRNLVAPLLWAASSTPRVKLWVVSIVTTVASISTWGRRLSSVWISCLYVRCTSGPPRTMIVLVLGSAVTASPPRRAGDASGPPDGCTSAGPAGTLRAALPADPAAGWP